jgi:hypothetical protein
LSIQKRKNKEPIQIVFLSQALPDKNFIISFLLS